jgi:hypothetical protein
MRQPAAASAVGPLGDARSVATHFAAISCAGKGRRLRPFLVAAVRMDGKFATTAAVWPASLAYSTNRAEVPHLAIGLPYIRYWVLCHE